MRSIEADDTDMDVVRIELDMLELVKSIGADSFGRCVQSKEAEAIALKKNQAASRIHQQYKQMFGSSPGRYLLDFYHVSEYLHAAGNETTALGQKWVKEQEKRLLEGDSEGVLKSLKQHLEEESLEDSKAPVRKAYRYLNSRKDQLNYPEARAGGLPLGSGND